MKLREAQRDTLYRIWSPSKGFWCHSDGTPIEHPYCDAKGILEGLQRLCPEEQWTVSRGPWCPACSHPENEHTTDEQGQRFCWALEPCPACRPS